MVTKSSRGLQLVRVLQAEAAFHIAHCDDESCRIRTWDLRCAAEIVASTQCDGNEFVSAKSIIAEMR